MSSMAYRDCLVYPYGTFKEKIKAVEDIKKEIKKRYGKRKKFDLFILDGVVVAEYKSEKYYH